METGVTRGPKVHVEHEKVGSDHVPNGDIPQAVYGEVGKMGGFRRGDHEDDFGRRREIGGFELFFHLDDSCGVDQYGYN